MPSKISLKDQSIFLVLGNALKQGTTIIQGVILARILSQHDFGSFRQVLLIVVLAYTLFYLCIAEGATYFLASLDKEGRKRFLFQSTALSLLLGLFAFVVMLCSRAGLAGIFNNPDLTTFLLVASLLPSCQMLIALSTTSLISVGEAKLNAYLDIINAVSGVLSVVAPLLLGYSLMTALFVFVCAQGLFAFLRIVIAIKKIGITFQLDWKLLKKQFGFSLPYWVSYTTFVIYAQMHKVLVSTFFSTADFAIFSVASIELPVLAKLSASIGLVLIPVCVGYQQSGKTGAVIDLWNKLTSKVALVTIPIFMLLILNAKNFMTILYGSRYQDAWLIFSVMLLILPLRICDTNSLFKITGKTKYIIVSSAGALFTGLLSGWLLIYPLGMLGPAIGLLIGRITQIAITLKYIKKDIPLSFAQAFVLNHAGKLLLVAALSFGITKVFLFPVHSALIQFMVNMIAGGILFIILSIRFKMLDDEDIQLIKRWVSLEPILK